MSDLEHVAELAVECIDQEGKAQPSPELVEAVAALTPEQATRMRTALAIARGALNRMRPLPSEDIVGTEIFRVLGRLAASPGAIDVLEQVLQAHEPTG